MAYQKYYAGIGSRKTPYDVLDEMQRLGAYWGNKGFTLRSGGADGADTAFENGAALCGGGKEIFLPWKGFNDNKSEHYKIPDLAFEIAEMHHPNWANLSDPAKKLMARNVLQVMGKDMHLYGTPECTEPTPSLFVLCWTPCGAEKASDCTRETGGTGMAIRLADSLQVPVFNMNAPNWEARLTEWVSGFGFEEEDLSGATTHIKQMKAALSQSKGASRPKKAKESPKVDTSLRPSQEVKPKPSTPASDLLESLGISSIPSSEAQALKKSTQAPKPKPKSDFNIDF